jgi:carboxylate-amine ligase
MIDRFTFGIEEEFFVAQRRTGNTVPRMPRAFLARCKARLGEQVTNEMLQSQIETTTAVCTSPAQAREELMRLRSGLAREAAALGFGVVAAGTHPLTEWREQRHTDKPRYDEIMDDLRMIGRRNVFCGLHVHIGLPDPERRIDVMRRLLPFLPLLLALSTSSPFWAKRRTGLVGYRLAAYDELPRTGLPPLFLTPADYHRYVDALVSAGVIHDASYLWWAIRPSEKFGTLELRVADSCTRMEDALCIAALYRCLARRLYHDVTLEGVRDAAEHAVVDENMWRAKRYGIAGSMIDPVRKALVPVRELVESLLTLIWEDAQALGCEAEVVHARQILAEGTSADRQLAIFDAARRAGRSRAEALKAVVNWLIEATEAGALVPA